MCIFSITYLSNFQILNEKQSKYQRMKQNNKENKKKQLSKLNAPHSVAQVFSIGRDINVSNPYHTDGDIEMYSEENLKLREQLRKDEEIQKQLDQLLALYPSNEQKITQETYKKYQKKIALILRPDIEQDQLKFVADQDWELDSQDFKGQYITCEKMKEALFQLVDVWTIGNSKQEYLSFAKLLKKKLQRVLKS